MARRNSLSELHELPAYSEVPLASTTPVALSPEALESNTIFKDDGRIDVDFNSNLVRALSQLRTAPRTPPPEYSTVITGVKTYKIRLNVVIHVVGSRGDVQPFIALGSELMACGHRVRLATHNVFEKFVRDSGLEFYPIGGDPAELMAYMVKNPGLVPSTKNRWDQITRKRLMVKEILHGCWESCIEPDTLTHEPFVADAIIANPPSFAHIHCAEALGIPVHLMFTMPWTSTKAFPHPLANMKNADGDMGVANYLSYGFIDWMTWQGLGDLINQWRKELDLEEVGMFDGPDLENTLKIPFTYCWSPALVPKPLDWPSYIDVCGFFFREAPQYEPPPDLRAFLEAGPPPIYIGFGSIVLEEPDRMSAVISQAVKAAGVRAVVSKGWSNLGGANDRIFYLGDCPHEWLFQHVDAVVHHGGAGTTACGLRNEKPTTVVPFFGDQPFWGRMVAAAGAGPSPIPHKELTADNLTEAIRFCLSSAAAAAASAIAGKMVSERGVQAAVDSFHRNLPLERLQCEIYSQQPATWVFTKGKRKIKLSKVAAETVLSTTSIDTRCMELHKTNPIVFETRRWDPISGGASAMMSTTTDLSKSLLGAFYKPFQELGRDQCAHRTLRKVPDDHIRASPSTSASAPTHDAMSIGKDTTSDTTSAASVTSTSTKWSGHEKWALAGKMAAASAKSLGDFPLTALNGMTVDIPLALTEGLRNAPRYYGEEVRDHGQVTGWKSGAVVAGKTFAWGMAEGVSDIIVKPYQGAKEEGMLGAVKGFGKGAGNMAAKTGAAMFGVIVYPGAGIAKSLKSSIHVKTRKKIVEARHKEGRWLIENGIFGAVDSNSVTTAFEALQKRKP